MFCLDSPVLPDDQEQEFQPDGMVDKSDRAARSARSDLEVGSQRSEGSGEYICNTLVFSKAYVLNLKCVFVFLRLKEGSTL